jgi:hypothetical protein
MSRRARIAIFLILSAAIVGGVFLHSPVPQSESYHHFADRRSFLGIPNCLDVLSNAAFLVVGFLGLWFLFRPEKTGNLNLFLARAERWPYAIFFLGVALTAFGSAYYHLAPQDSRLVWDRLPMTVGFMAFLAAMIAERISVRLGIQLLIPLLAVGAASVLYWQWTQLRGVGDLRFYIVVQLYPFLAFLLLLALFTPRYSGTAYLLVAVGLYALAKLFELLDRQIFALTGALSGHTLKHLTAGAATYAILRMLKSREPQGELFRQPE